MLQWLSQSNPEREKQRQTSAAKCCFERWQVHHYGMSDGESGRQSIPGKPQGEGARSLLKNAIGRPLKDRAVWLVAWN